MGFPLSPKLNISEEDIIDMESVIEAVLEVHVYFCNRPGKDDTKRTIEWFKTKNPNLGGIAPYQMIQMGRTKKLLKFILDSKDGNMA